MNTGGGGIELERTLDSIIVGARHRADLGDLDVLAASIDRDGMLQPPTITPDGVLVCGARRLAAIRQLGWRTVNVWVRSGISDRLGQLMAEQDDNVLHKPLTSIEAASLYRELKTVMAEDAARRQSASQFSSNHQPRTDGAGNFPAPFESAGRAGEQAAAMIPGSTSYKTLEKINYLQQLAADPAQPERLRADAVAALASIETGAPIHPAFERLRDTASYAPTTRDEELHAQAEQALARVKATTSGRRSPIRTTASASDEDVERWPVRAFVLTWAELESWWDHFDVAELATALTSEQTELFLRTAAGTADFADRLRAAVNSLDAIAPPQLRAL